MGVTPLNLAVSKNAVLNSPNRVIYLAYSLGKFFSLKPSFCSERDYLYKNKLNHINIIFIIMIPIILLALVIIGLIIMLRQVLKSDGDINLTVSLRKGEMNVRKKKAK